MAKPKITFHDKAINKKIQQEMTQRLRLSGEVVRAKIVRNISDSTRRLGPSKPGQPPHADTGTLRKSIKTEMIDDATVKIGTEIEYASFLEFGTSTMAPRPFLRRSLEEARQKIRKILNKPLDL